MGITSRNFKKLNGDFTGLFLEKPQFVNLVFLQNFATFTEERTVPHTHFISCDADALVLFLGLII